MTSSLNTCSVLHVDMARPPTLVRPSHVMAPDTCRPAATNCPAPTTRRRHKLPRAAPVLRTARAQSEAQGELMHTAGARSGGRSGAPGLRGGLERLTDLLAVLLVCCPLDLELRTVRARSCVQHRSVVGRVRCPLRGAVQQGAQASFLSHRVARRASRGAAGG